MADRVVTVFGGSGFVGRYVVQRLARRGDRIKVAVRRPGDAMFLKPLGSVGQIQIVQANVRNPGSVEGAVEGSHAVVNLVGILAASGKQTFMALQAEGALTIAKAARDLGAKQMIQMSAIGADPDGESQYAYTKALGEQWVLESFPDATVLRPSLVFGSEDRFFNRFASLAKMSPVMPLIAGSSRFQPVYVGDVADAAVAVLEAGKKAQGKIFELGGPKTYTFKELLQLTMDEAMVKRPFLPIPMPIARLQAFFAQMLPDPPLTPDQLKLLAKDNVVAEGANGFKTLGITPTPVEAIVPTYLKRYRPKGQFSKKQESEG